MNSSDEKDISEYENDFSAIKENFLNRLQKLKWKQLLGLFLVFTGILCDLRWPFGVLFTLWAIIDLRSGQTYILDEIHKRENPILYWIIVFTWLFLGLLYFEPVNEILNQLLWQLYS